MIRLPSPTSDLAALAKQPLLSQNVSNNMDFTSINFQEISQRNNLLESQTSTIALILLSHLKYL